ncbi:uncharacterized protein RAG0_00497 [Rhynchosporium agropyri]|uniref:Uncharacterized protein n=1 Tax=Rhynchosporium agropyri TaxID=914238 RepID=A0A1E1JTK6_9HELO|nr:uncharacterized protein RAG0_00497 [Rhynchosporium agropyri]
MSATQQTSQAILPTNPSTSNPVKLAEGTSRPRYWFAQGARKPEAAASIVQYCCGSEAGTPVPAVIHVDIGVDLNIMIQAPRPKDV